MSDSCEGKGRKKMCHYKILTRKFWRMVGATLRHRKLRIVSLKRERIANARNELNCFWKIAKQMQLSENTGQTPMTLFYPSELRSDWLVKTAIPSARGMGTREEVNFPSPLLFTCTYFKIYSSVAQPSFWNIFMTRRYYSTSLLYV